MKPERRSSITSRLTLFICSASTLILLALGIVIGEAVERQIQKQDTELLAGKIQLSRHIVESLTSLSDLSFLRHQFEDALAGHPGLSVIVQLPNGSPVFRTGNVAFPQQLAKRALEDDEAVEQWSGSDGHPYLGIAIRTTTPVVEAPTLIVQIATNVAHRQILMQACRTTLWILVGLGALLNGFLIWYVVRREMQPLQAIRSEASRITASRLDQRLSADMVPAELTQLVETLNEMLGRLEVSFRRLTDFSTDLAHELRTPLSGLLTQAQVTLSKSRSPTEYEDILISSTEELERLSRMVNDMLFIAQAENALVIPNREHVDLRSEAQAVLDFYEALADEKGIEFAIAGNGSIIGDRLMLRRAISNLLSNAVRHTPSSGGIGISVNAEGPAVRVAVSNTGSAISENQLSRLFDRFYRGDASRQRFADGAGLGLALTRSIAKAHGGDVTARSESGLTVFEISLPLTYRALEAAET